MNDTLEARQRRALYRAQHRGTKEMDVLLGRYAEAHVAALSEPELSEFEKLLAVGDPLLQGWIFGKESAAGTEFESWIGRIRVFHGLEPREAAR